ncbi:MAG: hypothetical protein WBK25_01410 [Candidatus Microthrix parvicella]
MFDAKKEASDDLIHAAIQPEVLPAEQFRGAMRATAKPAFSSQVCAIGVTDARLILVPIDRKLAPKGPAVSIRPPDILKTSVDGFGGGLSHFLTADWGDIRLDTSDKNYKFMALGGGMDQAFVGQRQMEGKQAFLEFPHAARNLAP